MSRRTMAPVYVGDVGVIIEPSTIQELPANIDTSKLSFRELCNVLVSVGIDVRMLIGVDNCNAHVNMVFLGDKEMPEGYNLFEHCSYCRVCWQLFRWPTL